MLAGGLRWGQHDVDAEGMVPGRVEAEDLVDDGGAKGRGKRSLVEPKTGRQWARVV